MDTEYIDHLFLELSQFTTATTSRELKLIKEIKKLNEERDKLIRELHDVKQKSFLKFWNLPKKGTSVTQDNQENIIYNESKSNT